MACVPGENRNFYAFIWHALFLAFVASFIDVNTVLSSFILNIGGSNIHVGIITAISIGLPMITQLLFAGFLSGRVRKKPFLLMGIYIRVLALAGIGYTLYIADSGQPEKLLVMVFVWIGLFSLSGAFAEISYQGILLEITSNDNRAIFTGIIGTFSLTTALFPLIAGTLIRYFGFTAVFSMILPLVAAATVFLARIRCRSLGMPGSFS